MALITLNFKRNVNMMPRNPDNGFLQTVGIKKVAATVPNVVGMTSVAGQTAIIAAGFRVGTITLTTGNITVQSLVPGTKYVVALPINITLTA